MSRPGPFFNEFVMVFERINIFKREKTETTPTQDTPSTPSTLTNNSAADGSLFENDADSHAPLRMLTSTTPDMQNNPKTDLDVDMNMALVKKSLKLLLDNRFNEAEEILQRHYTTDMHFALGYGAMITFQAIMTYDTKEIEKGYAILSQGLQLTDSKRQKKTDYLRMRAPSYEEVVAELLYAETLLLNSLLTFAQSDSVIAMIKGAVKGRTAYAIYKDLHAKYILKTDNGSSNSKKVTKLSNDFLSGILLGYGCFQIALAMVPPKLLKLLELVGLQGDTQTGLDALGKGVEMEGLRSPFCAQAIMVYHTAFKFNLDPYNIDLDTVDALIAKFLTLHPQCVSFHFFSGRSAILARDIPKGKDVFHMCIEQQNEWVTMHHTCWFELMWAAAMQQQWDQAADYAERLFGASNWSKTSYLYLLAVFRYAHYVDTDPSRQYANDLNITALFKDVKEYQIRIAGKRLQIEKYCVRKARTFRLQNNFLYLPALEALYVWGMFCLLNEEMAKKFIRQCEDKLETITDPQLCPDDRGLGYVMVGALWKHCYLLHLKEAAPTEENEFNLNKAEEALLKSLTYEKTIEKDHFVIAWGNYELAELHWLRGDYNQSTGYLKACKKVSAKVKYSLEGRIMFKVHNLNERLKQIKPV